MTISSEIIRPFYSSSPYFLITSLNILFKFSIEITQRPIVLLLTLIKFLSGPSRSNGWLKIAHVWIWFFENCCHDWSCFLSNSSIFSTAIESIFLILSSLFCLKFLKYWCPLKNREKSIRGFCPHRLCGVRQSLTKPWVQRNVCKNPLSVPSN